MPEIDRILRDLSQPGVPAELATLMVCLALSFALCWVLGRRAAEDSIWFGRIVIDGLMFPVLSLAVAYAAMKVLGHYQKVPLLHIAVPILVSLAGIRLLVRVLSAAFPDSGWAKLAERLFSWLAWLATVLWILGVLPAVMDEMDAINLVFGKTRISLLGVVQGTLSSGLVLVVALWISAVVEKRVLHDTVRDLSLRKIAVNATRAILLLVGLLFALSAVGVDLTALSVLGGALGVGLGLGLQKLAANYVSGFVILFERSLRIGDTVRVDNFEGVVADIKTRYTLIRANNGRESIVPNEKLITERIENLSLADTKVLVTTAVTVGYASDVDHVIALLQKAATDSARVLADPAPSARLANLGSDGLEFQLLFWISDPENGQINVRSDVNIRILKSLRAAGIDIPYPQRVVHMGPAIPTGASSSGTAATG